MKGVHTVNCSEVIRERRSIRKYKENVTIPQEDFERMLEAAMMAPSACNTRPWQFFVVINREMIAKLREAHPFTKMLSTASAAIVVCGRPDLQEGVCKKSSPSGKRPGIWNLLVRMLSIYGPGRKIAGDTGHVEYPGCHCSRGRSGRSPGSKGTL